jgi:ATP/maltotriose-dependent transcriptional regulator MalT
MLSSRLFLGEVAQVSRRVPHLLSTAVEQGNLFAATDLRTRMNLIWLAADDADQAREEVIQALKAWTRKDFHLQHYSSLLALAQIELYTGDAEVAFRQMEGQLKSLEESLLLRIQTVRIESRHLRARTALASAHGNQREQRLQIAENMARKISKERVQWGEPLAALIRAGISATRGDGNRTRSYLSESVAGFELANMALYAAAARRRLGQTLGGERGDQLLAEATSWMTQQQIKKPDRMTQMLAPGF